MNLPKGDRIPGLRTAAVGALILAAAFARADFSRADETNERVREQRRQKIANDMTQAERDRLKGNLQRFLKLPPEEQERLRRLDRELRDDERQSSGELRKTMENYVDWLETVSLGEREDLRGESSPDKRAALVRTMIDSHQKQDDFQARRRGPRPTGLSSSDIDAVMVVVEAALAQRGLRSNPQLGELKGLHRHAALIDLAFARPPVNRAESPAGRSEAPPVRPEAPYWSFPIEVINEMAAQIGNDAQRNSILEGAENTRHLRMFSLIRWGVQAEFDKLTMPDEETLVGFLAGLRASQQEEILRLPDTNRQLQELRDRYMVAHPEIYPKPPDWNRIAPFGRSGGGRRGGGQGGRGGIDMPGPRGGNPRDGRPEGAPGVRQGEQRRGSGA